MPRAAMNMPGSSTNSGHHLLAVINGILDMSKIETDNFEITPEPFAPGQVIAGCCDLLALRASEAGVALEKMPTGELPEMIADKRALNQILLNLLSNAIRFTDRGGKVTISACAEAGNIAFVVEDNGVGINEEDMARVGEPYFQARASYDRRHGGTGLGLSIVKGLVRLHGGEIDIRSRVGEGTRVSIRLPLDCERTQQPKDRAFQGPAAVTNYLAGQPASKGARSANGPRGSARCFGAYRRPGEEKCLSGVTIEGAGALAPAVRPVPSQRLGCGYGRRLLIIQSIRRRSYVRAQRA